MLDSFGNKRPVLHGVTVELGGEERVESMVWPVHCGAAQNEPWKRPLSVGPVLLELTEFCTCTRMRGMDRLSPNKFLVVTVLFVAESES